MVKPVVVPSEPILTGSVRKTLLQQQSEVTVKDPSTHASRQVRRLVASENNPYIDLYCYDANVYAVLHEPVCKLQRRIYRGL